MTTRTDKPTRAPAPLFPSEDNRVKDVAKRVASALLFIGLFSVFAAGAGFLQSQRCGFDTQKRPEVYEDNLFLPQAKYSKTLAFGHDMLLADSLYVRAVQAFGAQYFNVIKDYNSVFNFFDTIMELDPHFVDAILFGQMAMSESKEYNMALEIGRKGYIFNPDRYIFSFRNAFTCIYETRQWALAEHWVRLSMKAPDCPEWVQSLINKIKDEQGLYSEGVEYSIRRYLVQLQSGTNPFITEIIKEHVERGIGNLREDLIKKALDEYKKANNNKQPESVSELAGMTSLREYDDYDYAQLKTLMKREVIDEMLSNERRTNPKAKYEALFDTILGRVKKKFSGVPLPTTDTATDRDHYLIRKDVTPQEVEDGLGLIMTRHEARDYTKSSMLPFLRSEVEKFYQTKGRYPNPLDEAFPDGLEYSDPITGKLKYNPENGAVTSPSFPEL